MSESEKVKAYVGALMSDAFGLALHQPPTALAGLMTSDLFVLFTKNKLERSKNILLEEIKNGSRLPSEVDYDTFFGLIYRYADAVKRGTAERNLRLMAQVITNGATKDCGFTPDVLASHMSTLADLRRDEINALATLFRNCIAVTPGNEIGRNISMTEKTARELVPLVFSDDNEFYSCLDAITRTGLIYRQRVIDGGFGLSIRFHEIARLCEINVPAS